MNKHNRIFEFITLTSMVVGIVIGVGIFIKNDTGPNHVLNLSNGNGYIAIIAWFIIGISCVLAMICFIEIASSTAKKGHGTLPSWTSKFISRKAGSFVSLFFIFIYIPILYAFFSVLAVQKILVALNLDHLNHLSQDIIYIVLGLCIFTFFILLNVLTTKPGKYAQIAGTFIKIIPFALILVCGLFMPTNPNVFTKSETAPWNINSFFAITGPILFSFDGFIFAANLQKETKNKDVLYKALITGIITIIIVYVLETISLFMGTTDGSVTSLFLRIFGDKLTVFFNLILVIIVFTSLNGYTIIGSRYILLDSEIGLIHTFRKKITFRMSGFIAALIGLIYFIVLLSLGIFVNNGIHENQYYPIYYIDQFSNIISIFAFILYAVLMFSLFINKFTKKVKIYKKMKLTIVASIISPLILLTFTLYNLYLIIAIWDITSFILLIIVFINILLFIINEFLLSKAKPSEPIIKKSKVYKENYLNQETIK